MTWTWDDASARERAEWIRQHQRSMNREAVCALFWLTTEGEDMIRRGDNWREEYEVRP